MRADPNGHIVTSVHALLKEPFAPGNSPAVHHNAQQPKNPENSSLPVPQIGSGPLDARDTLAMPQLLWQDTWRESSRAGEQGAPTQWQHPAKCLRCAGNTSTSLARDSPEEVRAQP